VLPFKSEAGIIVIKIINIPETSHMAACTIGLAITVKLLPVHILMAVFASLCQTCKLLGNLICIVFPEVACPAVCPGV